jgi:hypothetical protein
MKMNHYLTVPGHELQVLRVNLENLVPSGAPKGVRVEDPVLVECIGA